MKNKILEVLQSKQAYAAYVAIVTGFLATNGITFEDNVDVITSKTYGLPIKEWLMVMLPILGNIISSISSKILSKELNFTYFKSSNFIVSVLSIFSIVIGVYVGDAIAGIIIAVISQILNFLYHLNLPTKENGSNKSISQ